MGGGRSAATPFCNRKSKHMTHTGTSEDTGDEPLTIDSAADRIAGLLSEDGDGEDRETYEAGEESEDFEPEQSDEDDAEDDGYRREPDDDTPITLNLGDQAVEVTLHELKRGFLREADYTRKTMALADDRRVFEQACAEVADQRESYGYALARLADFFSQQDDDEDLSALRQADPAEYAARLADRQVRAQQLEQLAAEQWRVEAEQAEHDAAAHAQHLYEEHHRLLDVLPHWADEGHARADSEAIARYGVKLGLTSQELGTIADHRLVKALLDAARWDALQARKPAVQARVAAVKTARPGTRTGPASRTSELARQKQRLAQSGRVQDAAAAIELLLG